MGETALKNQEYSKAVGSIGNTAVSRYDSVSGLLLASLALVGLITAILALLVFLNMNWNRSAKPSMFVFEELPAYKKKPKGVADDFKEPGVKELSEVPEPQLTDALEMVTQAVSSVRSALETFDGPASKVGPGDGLGDRRQKGLEAGSDGKPFPAEHWIVKYSTDSKESYAAQLDYFNIEIGSLSKDTSLIEYASNVSATKPDYRKGTRKDEKRVYFKKPNDHPALKWDKAFLSNAGAEIVDRYVFTFYPAATILNLKKLEQQALLRDKKKMSDVQRTVFTVETVLDGKFEFKLSSIKYN